MHDHIRGVRCANLHRSMTRAHRSRPSGSGDVEWLLASEREWRRAIRDDRRRSDLLARGRRDDSKRCSGRGSTRNGLRLERVASPFRR